jgi:hypothetical protein
MVSQLLLEIESVRSSLEPNLGVFVYSFLLVFKIFKN